MPLTQVKVEQKVKVQSITGCSAERLRLVNLGIIPGCTLKVLQRYPATLSIGLQDSRLMIDAKMAEQIQVQ
jgi:ferrous iron transport protein A